MGAYLSSGSFISSSSQIGDDVILNADIADDSIETDKIKSQGTATHVLTSNGSTAGNQPTFQSLPIGATQDYVKLETVTVTGSARDNITTASMTGSTYRHFFVVFNVQTTSTGDMGIRINEDDTANAYVSNVISRASTTIAAVDLSNTFGLFNSAALNSVYYEGGTITVTNNTSKFNAYHADMIVTTSSGANYCYQVDGKYMDTDDCEKLSLYSPNDTFIVGSTMTVYGALL